MSLYTLKDHQRELIPSFHEYNIDASGVIEDEGKMDGPYYVLGQLESFEPFNPEEDAIDKLIWAEITQQRNEFALRFDRDPFGGGSFSSEYREVANEERRSKLLT